jgi:hypothetical protein
LRLGGLFDAAGALAELAATTADPEATSARSGVTTPHLMRLPFSSTVATAALAGADFCSAFAFAFNSSSFAARSLFFTSSSRCRSLTTFFSNSFSGQPAAALLFASLSSSENLYHHWFWCSIS